MWLPFVSIRLWCLLREVLNKNNGVNIAAVAACFPASQSFIEVKVAETALTVKAGADEIDVVISLENL